MPFPYQALAGKVFSAIALHDLNSPELECISIRRACSSYSRVSTVHSYFRGVNHLEKSRTLLLKITEITEQIS